MTTGSVSTAEVDPQPAAEAPRPQRVEISVPVRTLIQLLMFAALVALALLSLGTLISILLASVLAFGLDPPVSALVQRGWKRGRGLAGDLRRAVRRCLRPGAGQRRAGVGPDRRVRPPAAGLLGQADGQARVQGDHLGGQRGRARQEAAGRSRPGAARCRHRFARCRGRRVRLGALARDAHVPRPVPADGAPDDHRTGCSASRRPRSRRAGGRWSRTRSRRSRPR